MGTEGKAAACTTCKGAREVECDIQGEYGRDKIWQDCPTCVVRPRAAREAALKATADFDRLCSKYITTERPTDPNERPVWDAVQRIFHAKVEQAAEGRCKMGGVWYRAFKNYLHNDKGTPTRKELTEMVAAAVEKMAREEIGRQALTNAFYQVVRDRLKFIEPQIKSELTQAIARELVKDYRVKIEKAEGK